MDRLYALFQEIEVAPFFIWLFAAMLVFMLLVVFIPLVVFLNRMVWYLCTRNTTRQILAYEQSVIEYLAKEGRTEPSFTNLGRYSNRDLLYTILLDLFDYVEGEDRSRLKELIRKEQLGEYCLRKLRSPFSFNKFYYLQRLSTVAIDNRTEALFRKLLTSRSADKRMYAMQGLIYRHPEEIERLFSGYEYPLSLWEQMNYYLFFVSRDIIVPDFHPLTLSKNDQVALFAIRMVRLFHQRIGSIAGYESLLEHPNLEVQIEVFCTLTEFGYDNLEELLNKIRVNVSLPIRRYIMTYISKTSKIDVKTLMQYYQEDNDIEFKQHILYCIYNFVSGGKESIETYAAQREDQLLHDLSSHLITNLV